MSLPSINFLHLTVSEIQPGQTFSRHPPACPTAHPDTMGENNTPTALKGCGVKTITSINLKFGRQVFHGVQTDFSKFGVICLKIKVRRVFLIFNWEYTVKLLLFITYVKNSIRDAHTPQIGILSEQCQCPNNV